MKNIPENLKNDDFYLARSEAYRWFNLIIRVVGESPFLTLEAWDLSKDSLYKIKSYDIGEWGPKISHSELLTPLTKPSKQL